MATPSTPPDSPFAPHPPLAAPPVPAPMPQRPRVLVTGFEPFGSVTRNAAGEAALALPGRNRLAGVADVSAKVLPVVYFQAPLLLRQAIHAFNPDIVICTGIHRRETFRFERLAHNLDHTPTPDNAGTVRIGKPIAPTLPATIPTELPWRAMAERFAAEGWPHEISDTAGHYLCNHVFFHVLTLGLIGLKQPLAGFVHLPPLLDPLGPYTLDMVVAGLEAVVEISAAHFASAWHWPHV